MLPLIGSCLVIGKATPERLDDADEKVVADSQVSHFSMIYSCSPQTSNSLHSTEGHNSNLPRHGNGTLYTVTLVITPRLFH